MKKQISISKIKNIVLFGGGQLLLDFSLWSKSKFNILIITSPRQARELMPHGNCTFKEELEKNKLNYLVTDKINSPKVIKLIKNDSLGIGFGEVWTFEKSFIKLFSGNLFDFMGIPLPKYRGGAHYTWAILNNEKNWGCHIQVINEDMIQGVFDSGKIIYSKEYKIKIKNPNPEKIFAYTLKKEITFLQEFINQIIKGKDFFCKTINEKHSLYFPRLNTFKNGIIDWKWSGKNIVDFINSFSYPYVGASSKINGNLIRIYEARLVNKKKYHPFLAGLVLRNFNSKVVVATNEGEIEISKINEKESDLTIHDIKIGMRLYNDNADILESMIYKPEYDPYGDKKQRKKKEISIQNKTILLREVEIKDCNEEYLSWLQDSDINQYLETRWEYQSISKIKNFVRDKRKSYDEYLFAIIDIKTKKHIGNIKLGPINFNHKSAEISYFIGNKDFQNKGFSTNAIELILKVAFLKLKLKYISAGVYSNNKASCSVLKKNKFSIEGNLKNSILNNKKRGNRLIFGISDAIYKS